MLMWSWTIMISKKYLFICMVCCSYLIDLLFCFCFLTVNGQEECGDVIRGHEGDGQTSQAEQRWPQDDGERDWFDLIWIYLIDRNRLHFIQKLYIVSWEPEGRYQYSKMFRWEPEGHFCCTKSMVIVPFWFSMEHLWIVIASFWLSADGMSCNLKWMYIFDLILLDFKPFGWI